MLIDEIIISGVRNLQTISLKPSKGFNQFVGNNGAGKSSVLEALYILSSGHSFRTRRAKELLNQNNDPIVIVAKLLDNVSDVQHQAGYSRDSDGNVTVKLNYERLNSIAEMSKLIPIKALSPDSHKLIQDSPDLRRQFIDWGVFHVEHEFFGIWKDYKRALSQRNQTLRTHRPLSEISAWDNELATPGDKINQFRRNYLLEFEPLLQKHLHLFDLKTPITMSFKQGWKSDKGLFDSLKAEHENPHRQPFTTVGPHRAELALTAHNQPAKQVLSRGEQKLLVYAMHFAQLELLVRGSETSPIVLCDDLAAELDDAHRLHVLESLKALSVQSFITGNRALDVPRETSQARYQIDDGNLLKVL